GPLLCCGGQRVGVHPHSSGVNVDARRRAFNGSCGLWPGREAQQLGPPPSLTRTQKVCWLTFHVPLCLTATPSAPGRTGTPVCTLTRSYFTSALSPGLGVTVLTLALMALAWALLASASTTALIFCVVAFSMRATFWLV